MKWLLLATALYGHDSGLIQGDTRQLLSVSKVFSSEADCRIEEINLLKQAVRDGVPHSIQCINIGE